MLAAHRNGGRTSLASFARAWDRYTRARGRPRPATDREVTTLRTMLEASIVLDETPALSGVERPRRERRPTGERHRARELRHQPGWAWLRPFRRLDEYERAVSELLSPGRTNWISGTMQWGDVRRTKRIASAMSSAWIISSFGTCPSIQSVMSVATKPGHSAVT